MIFKKKGRLREEIPTSPILATKEQGGSDEEGNQNRESAFLRERKAGQAESSAPIFSEGRKERKETGEAKVLSSYKEREKFKEKGGGELILRGAV